MEIAIGGDRQKGCGRHLRQGSRSMEICFLTIVSKAMSGVKRPVLREERKL